MAWVTIKSLHRVLNNHREKFLRANLLPNIARRLATLKRGKKFGLLRRSQINKRGPIESPAGLVDADKSLPISLSQMFEWPAKLAVNVIHYSRPRRAGILIRGNDLVTNRRQSPGFIHGEESPRTANPTAGNRRSCCGHPEGHLHKFPTAKFPA